MNREIFPETTHRLSDSTRYKEFINFALMKTIQIQAQDFFELLKQKDTSMWEVFAQMVDGEEKLIEFIGKDQKIAFNYILPPTLEKLNEDRKIFAKEYAQKLAAQN